MPTPFSPAYFQFFRELAAHNDKPWFEANRARFEADVRGPLVDFVLALREPVAAISPHIVVDPRPNGGSIFRIFRDTRFSADKTPYKTHGALQLRHAAGKDVHAPGFYVHLGPGEVIVGAGLWRPEPEVLTKLRARIQAEPAAWTEVKASLGGRSLGGESLKRPPAGVPADHPHLDDLKRKDFVLMAELPEAAALDAGFLDRVVGEFRAAVPLMRFLCGAQRLPF